LNHQARRCYLNTPRVVALSLFIWSGRPLLQLLRLSGRRALLGRERSAMLVLVGGGRVMGDGWMETFVDGSAGQNIYQWGIWNKRRQLNDISEAGLDLFE